MIVISQLQTPEKRGYYWFLIYLHILKTFFKYKINKDVINMVECNQEDRMDMCNCSYNCSRRGKCCECISYHLQFNELPGCVFAKISADAEKTYNRDFKYFAELVLKLK